MYSFNAELALTCSADPDNIQDKVLVGYQAAGKPLRSAFSPISHTVPAPPTGSHVPATVNPSTQVCFLCVLSAHSLTTTRSPWLAPLVQLPHHNWRPPRHRSLARHLRIRHLQTLPCTWPRHCLGRPCTPLFVA